MTTADQSDHRRPLDRLLDGLPEAPEPGSPAAAILDAARGLFAAHGFAGTSTRGIAGAAGVNLAMIHYYYGNKEQLYRRVVELQFADLFRLLRDGIDPDAPPQELLPALPGFILALHRRHPELMQLLLREMLDGAPRLPELVRGMGEHGPLGMRGILRGMIERAQADGFAPGIPSAHLLALFFSLGNGLVAFAPLVAEVFGLDLNDEATAAALGRSAGTIVRRALTPGKED